MEQNSIKPPLIIDDKGAEGIDRAQAKFYLGLSYVSKPRYSQVVEAFHMVYKLRRSIGR